MLSRWDQEHLGYHFSVIHWRAGMMIDVDTLCRRYGGLLAQHILIASILPKCDKTCRSETYPYALTNVPNTKKLLLDQIKHLGTFQFWQYLSLIIHRPVPNIWTGVSRLKRIYLCFYQLLFMCIPYKIINLLWPQTRIWNHIQMITYKRLFHSKLWTGSVLTRYTAPLQHVHLHLADI